MFAKVYKLRSMGGLNSDKPPSNLSQWASGILEFSTAAGDGVRFVPRRLVLRNAMANPTKGVMLELYRPELIDARHPHLRVRGIEPTPLGTGQICAMVQEWLIVIG